MLFPTDLKNHVILPALSSMATASGKNLASSVGINLVLGTIIHESVSGKYQRLVQAGGGPALGIGQVEPITGHDVIDRWLSLPANALIKASVKGMMTQETLERQLITNLSFVACVIRLRFFMSPAVLPATNDAVALCRMWKKVYNTSLGAGELSAQTISAFQQAIDA